VQVVEDSAVLVRDVQGANSTNQCIAIIKLFTEFCYSVNSMICNYK